MTIYRHQTLCPHDSNHVTLAATLTNFIGISQCILLGGNICFDHSDDFFSFFMFARQKRFKAFFPPAYQYMIFFLSLIESKHFIQPL